MEQGKVPCEDLQIKLVLQKNTDECLENSLQRRLSLENGGDFKQGDYKPGGGTTNPSLYSRKKYLEIRESAFKDVLAIMGFDYKRDIIGFTSLSAIINK